MLTIRRDDAHDDANVIADRAWCACCQRTVDTYAPDQDPERERCARCGAYRHNLWDSREEYLLQQDLLGDDDADDDRDLSDVEADAATLASAGWGTDEDYGYFGGEDY